MIAIIDLFMNWVIVNECCFCCVALLYGLFIDGLLAVSL